MDAQTNILQQTLAAKLEALWQEVSWQTPRDKADRVRREAMQACHAFHRVANPAYRERCAREQIGEQLELAQLAAVSFPEEIYKGYSEKKRANGQKLGVFCEQDVPLLLEYLNHYLTRPLTTAGLKQNYMSMTNIKGGLDQLRADLFQSQGIVLVTSSGTTGSAVSLIPIDPAAFETLLQVNGYSFAEISNVPGYGPIDPDQHRLVAYTPQQGSVMMAFVFSHFAKRFGDRAVLAIPANARTRELRWRGGVYTGFSGKLLQRILPFVLKVGSKQTSRKAVANLIAALKQAEAAGVRTAVFANPWMTYNALKQMATLLAAEIERGEKQPGDHYVNLSPGSVLIFGGGNKSGLDISESDLLALFHKIIGGLDRVVDVYSQAEALGTAIKCAAGHYHLDPHTEFFMVDSYLAYYDPRQDYRVPGIVTGDLVDGIHEDPCPCGAPTRYFQSIQRDNAKRGAKGCAAALAEYA